MLISHSKRFIFVHIYKTAGTSVMDVFLPYSRLIDRLAYDYKYSRKLFSIINNLMGWHDDGMKQFTGFHKHSKAHEIREKIGNSIFDSYYKFSFIRNPFDWLVSLYYFILQYKNHFQHDVLVNMSFLDFIRWHIANKPPLQLNFITDPYTGQSLVDYIGRFETLEKDIAVIQKKLGLEMRRSIKHKNPSFKRKSKEYKKYYDEESKNLVKNYFQPDLDKFGYDFDGFNEKYTDSTKILATNSSDGNSVSPYSRR